MTRWQVQQEARALLQGFGDHKQSQIDYLVQNIIQCALDEMRMEFDWKWDEKWDKKTQLIPEE